MKSVRAFSHRRPVLAAIALLAALADNANTHIVGVFTAAPPSAATQFRLKGRLT